MRRRADLSPSQTLLIRQETCATSHAWPKDFAQCLPGMSTWCGAHLLLCSWFWPLFSLSFLLLHSQCSEYRLCHSLLMKCGLSWQCRDFTTIPLQAGDLRGGNDLQHYTRRDLRTPVSLWFIYFTRYVQPIRFMAAALSLHWATWCLCRGFSVW